MTSCTDGNCNFCAGQNRDGKYVTACGTCRGGLGLAGAKATDGSIAVKRPALKTVNLSEVSKSCACSDRHCQLCSRNGHENNGAANVLRLQIDRKHSDSKANDGVGDSLRFRTDRKQSDSTANDDVADSRQSRIDRKKLDLTANDGASANASNSVWIDRKLSGSKANETFADSKRFRIDRTRSDSTTNDGVAGFRPVKIDRKLDPTAKDTVAVCEWINRKASDLAENNGNADSRRLRIDRTQSDSTANDVADSLRFRTERKQTDAAAIDSTTNVTASRTPTAKSANERKKFCVDKTCALCSSHDHDSNNVPACGGYLRTDATTNDTTASLSARVRHSSAGNLNSKLTPLSIDKYFRLVNTLDRSDAPSTPATLCCTEIDIKDSQPPHDDRSSHLGCSTDIVSSVNSLLIRSSLGLRNAKLDALLNGNGNGYGNDGVSDVSSTTTTRSRADSKNGGDWHSERRVDVSNGSTHGNAALSFADTKRFVREADLSEAELAILLRRHASKLSGVIGRLEQMDVDGTGLIDGFETLPANTEQEIAFRNILADIQAREARRRNAVNTVDRGTQFDSQLFNGFVSARVNERVDQLENERKRLSVLKSRHAFVQFDAGLYDQFLNATLHGKIERLFANSNGPNGSDDDNDNPIRNRTRELLMQQLERERQQRAVDKMVQYDYRTRVEQSENGSAWSPLRSIGTQLTLSELDMPVDDLRALLSKHRKDAMRILAELGAKNHDSREFGSQLSLTELDLTLDELQALLRKNRKEALRILAQTGMKDRACCESAVQVVTDELGMTNDDLETLLKKNRKEAMRILAQCGLTDHACREVGSQLSFGELDLSDEIVEDLLIKNRLKIQQLFAQMGIRHGLSREAGVQLNADELEFSSDDLNALMKKNRPEIQRRLAALAQTDHSRREVGQQLSFSELDLSAEELEKLLRNNRKDAKRLLTKFGLEDHASLEVGVQLDPELLEFTPEQLEKLLHKVLPNNEKVHQLLNSMMASLNGSQYDSEKFTQTDSSIESMSSEELQNVLRKYKDKVRDFAKLLQEEAGLLVDACIGPDDSQIDTKEPSGKELRTDQCDPHDVEDSFKSNWCRKEDPSTSKHEEDDIDKQRLICTEKATTTYAHLEHMVSGKLNDQKVPEEFSLDGRTEVQLKHDKIPDEHQRSESNGVVTHVTRHREKDSLTATQTIRVDLNAQSLLWLNAIAPFFDSHKPIDPAAEALDED